MVSSFSSSFKTILIQRRFTHTSVIFNSPHLWYISPLKGIMIIKAGWVPKVRDNVGHLLRYSHHHGGSNKWGLSDLWGTDPDLAKKHTLWVIYADRVLEIEINIQWPVSVGIMCTLDSSGVNMRLARKGIVTFRIPSVAHHMVKCHLSHWMAIILILEQRKNTQIAEHILPWILVFLHCLHTGYILNNLLTKEILQILAIPIF